MNTATGLFGHPSRAPDSPAMPEDAPRDAEFRRWEGPVVEVVNTRHCGRNEGTATADSIVFQAGTSGTLLAFQETPESMPSRNLKEQDQALNI